MNEKYYFLPMNGWETEENWLCEWLFTDLSEEEAKEKAISGDRLTPLSEVPKVLEEHKKFKLPLEVAEKLDEESQQFLLDNGVHFYCSERTIREKNGIFDK